MSGLHGYKRRGICESPHWALGRVEIQWLEGVWNNSTVDSEKGKENRFPLSVPKSKQEVMVVVVGDRGRMKCWDSTSPLASL